MKERLRWCDQVCQCIRFKPDREAVRLELLGHMEDEYEMIRASGLCENEAEQRTLEAMGDPAEVGRLLDSVHKPLLGWVWLISKWLVALAMVAAAVCLYFGWDSYFWTAELLSFQDYLDPEVDIYQAENGDTSYRLCYTDGGGRTASTDGYTFRMEKAAVWRSGDWFRLYGNLTVDGFLPWEDGLNLSEFYAVDDLGNCYNNFHSGKYGINGPPEGVWIKFNREARTLFSWKYAMWLSGLDPEAQWIELRYNQEGRNIRLRIDLTGGESG